MGQDRKYSPEDVFGVLLLIGAFSLVGLFSFQSDEPLVEAGIRAQAHAITKDSIHGITAQVDGRRITVTGLADTEAEKTKILSALRAIDGRGRMETDITVLDPADPFVTTATKDRTITLSGAVPTEALRNELAQDHGADGAGLVLASGAPDADWGAVMGNALRALDQLEEGQVVLEGRALSLTGTALTPAVQERALLLLDDLPEGYRLTHDLTQLDDGTPLRLTASRTDGQALRLTGKLPADLVETLHGENKELAPSPLTPPFDGWGQGVQTGLDALSHLKSGYLSVIGTNLTLTGDAWSQDAYDATLSALDTLPAAMQVSHDIRLADSGAPFGLTLQRQGDTITASGKVPQSLAPPVLAALAGQGIEADALEIARVSPGGSFWEGALIATQALTHIETGEVVFLPPSLTITATLADPPAEQALKAHLAALPDGITPDLSLTLIDDGSPLRLNLRHDGAVARLRGKRPETLNLSGLQDALGLTIDPVDLITTPRPAPEGWAEAALTAASALALTQEGQVQMTGLSLRLSGTVRSPAEERAVLQALSRLPEGAEAETNLTFLDDGRPFAFTLAFDGQAAVLSGKTPQDLGPASQAAILGHPVNGDTAELSRLSADVDWWSAARAGIRALATLETGQLSMDSHQITLTGTAPRADIPRAIAQALEPYKDGFKISIEITTP